MRILKHNYVATFLVNKEGEIITIPDSIKELEVYKEFEKKADEDKMKMIKHAWIRLYKDQVFAEIEKKGIQVEKSHKKRKEELDKFLEKEGTEYCKETIREFLLGYKTDYEFGDEIIADAFALTKLKFGELGLSFIPNEVDLSEADSIYILSMYNKGIDRLSLMRQKVSRFNSVAFFLLDEKSKIIPLPEVVKNQKEYKEFEKNANERQKIMIEHAWPRLYKMEMRTMVEKKDLEIDQLRYSRQKAIDDFLEKDGAEYTEDTLVPSFVEEREDEDEILADKFAITEAAVDKEDLTFLPEGFNFDKVRSVAILSILEKIN